MYILQKVKRALLSASAIAITFSPTAYAQDAEPSEKPVATEANEPATPVPSIDAKPALWVVKDEDTTIYLFGTIHLLRPGYAWFDEAVKEAFDNSDTLALEVKFPDAAETAALFQKYMPAEDGKPLSSKLNEEQKKQLESTLAELNIPLAALEPLDPWGAAIVMTQVMAAKTGMHPDDGVEANLTEAANKSGKAIVGLETVEGHLGTFENMPLDKQVAFLTADGGTLKEAQEVFDTMISSWASGEPQKLASLMNKGFDDPYLYRRLLTHRNADWARWIAQRMEQPGTVFMAVGAGHLAGTTSVQKLVASYGIESERVNY